MKEKYSIAAKDLVSLLPASLALGAIFILIQSGNWQSMLGVLSFSFLFLLSIAVLKIAYNWSNGGKLLGTIIALTFLMRLVVGTLLHVALPVYGHDDEDDRAGYVFTDAHTRDDQAWMLAASDRPILDAFSRNYSSDQYGGLLAFNALIYRYLSPDAQRPLMLILVSAFFAALGVPFLWKAVRKVFGERVAWAASWIFALYPGSILLGASAMREPYLLTFSAFAFWGFVNSGVLGPDPVTGDIPPRHDEPSDSRRNAYIWLGLGLLGMLLVSPAVALVTLVLLGGWVFYGYRDRQISWKVVAGIAVIFLLGLFLLSSSLNRAGEIESASPLSLIANWLKLAVRLNVYQIEEGSGWVQKIFDESPTWIRLPFVAVYGIFQPVLPAAIIRPTKPIWSLIVVLLGLGWYALIPLLLLSFVAAAKHSSRTGETGRTRNLILWLSLLTWVWILLSALRGGGDLWDNPRYRTILFLWQAILAGYVWVWWRETRNPWFWRIVLMEVVFLVIFTHWYGSRYYHWPGQMPFPLMVAVILGLWGIVLGAGWRRDKWRA